MVIRLTSTLCKDKVVELKRSEIVFHRSNESVSNLFTFDSDQQALERVSSEHMSIRACAVSS